MFKDTNLQSIIKNFLSMKKKYLFYNLTLLDNTKTTNIKQ